MPSTTSILCQWFAHFGDIDVNASDFEVKRILENMPNVAEVFVQRVSITAESDVSNVLCYIAHTMHLPLPSNPHLDRGSAFKI